MKKLVVIIFAVAIAFSSCKKKADEAIVGCMDSNAQNFNAEAVEDDGTCAYLTSTEAQKQNVVLEEFTGVHCGYCPDGHRRAQTLADAYPGKVVLINVHTGSFSSPYSGQADYRTAFGTSLASQAKVSGYPAGSINRNKLTALTSIASSLQVPSSGSNYAYDRDAFEKAGKHIMTLNSPVNLGIATSFDDATRELSVTVEMYYTTSEAVPNYLNVAILENNIISKQEDYDATVTPVVNYVHRHMLRHLVTGQWGQKVESTIAGERMFKKFTYTVPATFNADNCDVAAFVTQEVGGLKMNILNGVQKSLK